VDINYQNEHGSSALVLAIKLGYVGFVEVLLKQGGIPVNLQNKSGNTALISASRHGHLDIAKALFFYPRSLVNQLQLVSLTT
jgi:ankyrin repeat protein